MIPTLEWTSDGVRFLDQTRLPLEETYVLARTHQDVADVIRTMVVRGAPAIGVAAAMGVALAAKNLSAEDLALGEMHKQLEQEVIPLLAATRPTAVNLFWGLDRMRRTLHAAVAKHGATTASVRDSLIAEARTAYDEDIAACRLRKPTSSHARM